MVPSTIIWLFARKKISNDRFGIKVLPDSNIKKIRQWKEKEDISVPLSQCAESNLTGCWLHRHRWTYARKKQTTPQCMRPKSITSPYGMKVWNSSRWQGAIYARWRMTEVPLSSEHILPSKMGFWTQTFATEVANVCEGGCKRLREGLQTFASRTGKNSMENY